MCAGDDYCSYYYAIGDNYVYIYAQKLRIVLSLFSSYMPQVLSSRSVSPRLQLLSMMVLCAVVACSKEAKKYCKDVSIYTELF